MIEETLCPVCKSKMVSRLNKKTNERFWGCPMFPQCKGTRDNQGRSKQDIEKEREEEEMEDYDTI